MNFWQTILISLGGNAILVAALAWLGKSFVSIRAARDIERYKTRLKAEADGETERIRHILELSKIERQLQLPRFYQKRGEVIAEVYRLLVHAHRAVQAFLLTLSVEMNAEAERDADAKVVETCTELYDYFDQNRIYLPAAICSTLENLARSTYMNVTNSQLVSPRPLFARTRGLPLEDQMQHWIDWQRENGAKWEEYWKFFSEKVPEARRALEQELRTLLGEEMAANPAVQGTLRDKAAQRP